MVVSPAATFFKPLRRSVIIPGSRAFFLQFERRGPHENQLAELVLSSITS